MNVPRCVPSRAQRPARHAPYSHVRRRPAGVHRIRIVGRPAAARLVSSGGCVGRCRFTLHAADTSSATTTATDPRPFSGLLSAKGSKMAERGRNRSGESIHEGKNEGCCSGFCRTFPSAGGLPSSTLTLRRAAHRAVDEEKRKIYCGGRIVRRQGPHDLPTGPWLSGDAEAGDDYNLGKSLTRAARCGKLGNLNDTEVGCRPVRELQAWDVAALPGAA